MLKLYKLSLLVKIVLLLILIPALEPAYAQSPPLRFVLESSFEAGKITYSLDVLKRVDWNITDITIKIPIPVGTRFLEANATPAVDVTFNGKDVVFFSSSSRRIRLGDAIFVVEVIDPTVTIFTTQPIITWKGDYPGDSLLNEVTIDISKAPLIWDPPAQPKLRLETEATVDDGIITYFIYPTHDGRFRMWDLRISVPIPEGATFLSANAPDQFVVNFDGQEVSFSAIELARQENVDALVVKISNANKEIKLYTWATWKNSDRRVGVSEVFQEDVKTSDLIIQPGVSERVFTDAVKDVPLSNYDIVNVNFKDYTSAFKVAFYTAEGVGTVGSSDYLDFRLYVDSDCNMETGQSWNGMGSDYYVRYRHDIGEAQISSWDKEEEIWQSIASQLQVDVPLSGNGVSMWVPYDILNLKNERQFCWWSLSRNYTQEFVSALPTDYIIPSSVIKLTPSGETPPDNPLPAVSIDGTFIDIGDTWQYLPGWTEPDSGWMNVDFDDSSWFSGPTGIGYGSGKLATNLNLITGDIQDEGPSTPALVERTSKETGVTLITLSSGADNVSLYIRRAFTVTDLLTQLTLDINYEDGFVAYLNGEEVARRGLNVSPIFYDTFATQQHKSDTEETIDLSEYIPRLNSGTNVLAIQVHRAVHNSLNLFVAPKLTWQYNPQDVIGEQESDILANESASPPSTLFTARPLSDISGKLAVPIDTGQVTYDVRIFSLPDGQEVIKIPNARQPDFRFDGERLLINREGGGVEDVYEYNFVDGSESKVTDAPQDWHPVYDPWGNRVAYGNAELTVGRSELLLDEKGEVVTTRQDGNLKEVYRDPHRPFIFVQCGLLPPHQEVEPRCRDIPWLGVLVPAGQVGEIVGTHPVWTSNDMIAYKGCNSWAGSSLCGIYIVPSASTKGFSNGFIPKRLTEDTSDIPTDTQGILIAFMSARDGNWEAYIMGLNGDGVKNISNGPDSNDGLPTISPDGNWVAFVSDRGGQWAVWVVPAVGGVAQKLFDLPTSIPWGDGDRIWTTERISWGP